MLSGKKISGKSIVNAPRTSKKKEENNLVVNPVNEKLTSLLHYYELNFL